MKKTKILSLLLCLSLFCALIVPGTRAYADNEPGSGMKISKTATANQDGSYTITLEAYATGEKVISEITKDVPTDIILVLDQSGSMADPIGAVSFEQYKDESDWWGNTIYRTRNQDYYEYRHNDGSANLWHKLSDDSYVSVSVTKTTEYTELPTSLSNYDTNFFGNLTTDCYYYYANNLYEKVGTEHKQVTLTRERSGRTYNYTYTFSDGTTVVSSGDNASPNLGTHSPLYTPSADGSNTVYTYTYTDKDGNVQTIGTSKGATTVFSPTLYERVVDTSAGDIRLDALKSAANAFANAVAVKAAGEDGDINTTADNVNHRIAVVGFASQSGNGNNTELLSIAGNNSGSVGVAYNNITNQNLKDVLQSMDTQNGQTMVNAAIDALAANGATRTDLGMDMAQRILNANPVPTGETRNRVVIVFTDGSPTDRNGFQKDVANTAISTADAIKGGGTTVYSIGIFSGADASTAGKEPDKDYEDYILGSNYTDAEMSAACNWFMQKVSSNDGTPRTPSYYLSAGDKVSLNSIFQQISDQIETGGAETTLGSETVVKDIISPYFTLPAGTTASGIRIDTYACTGKDGNTYTWSGTSGGPGGATATVDGNQVSVTGFNFSENWVGTETNADGTIKYRGNKLVIKFTVKPRPGFLGGNNVFTNGEKSGLYENSNAENALEAFPQPQVNVPIQDVAVTAAEKNVYLLGGLTADELKSGATVKVGGVALDLSKASDTTKPWGLEPWQTEYVDITVTVKDKDGNAIPADGLIDLTADTTYTISVTVAPITNGDGAKGTANSMDGKTGSANASINVFKPELTFKDSTAYYGQPVPTGNDFSANKVSEVWKHNTTEDSSVTMTGEKPTLDITYAPDNTKVYDGKYGKQDVPVSATVKIGTENVNGHTTFVHQDCTTACGWENPATPGAPAFLIHIQTCTLEIKKTGGADDESYVFDVLKDGEKYSEVTVWGNGTETLVELPIGTYTVEEDTGWSWRYNADNGSGAALSAANPNGSITCTNSSNGKIYWLNGFSQVVRNIFGISH